MAYSGGAGPEPGVGRAGPGVGQAGHGVGQPGTAVGLVQALRCQGSCSRL